ncbi:MAG: hypothetical protein ACK5NC_14640 [Vibrio sp.]
MNTLVANPSLTISKKVKNTIANVMNAALLYGLAIAFISLTALTWVKF